MPFIQHNGKRALFIHIPKTGGTSIETWLESIAPLRLFSVGIPHSSRCTPQHYRAQDIHALLGPDFFDLALAVVRNPYDRIASEYRMQAEIAQKGFWKKPRSFSAWLEEHLEKQRHNRFHLDNHLRPQWEFISNNVEIFRFEDGLAAPIARLSQVLGVPTPDTPPHKLRTHHPPIEWDITDRLRVQEHYAQDFDYFGYSTAY